MPVATTVTTSPPAAGGQMAVSVLGRPAPNCPLECKPHHDVATAEATLGDALEMAIELNRSRAETKGVRLHGYAIDRRLPLASLPDLLARLDDLIGLTIAAAAWGSAITIEASINGSEARLGLHFARESASASCSLGVEPIDEIWSWCFVKQRQPAPLRRASSARSRWRHDTRHHGRLLAAATPHALRPTSAVSGCRSAQ